MKMHIRGRIFLPVLVLLFLLPLASYLVFSATADRYMKGLAAGELQGLLEAVQPVADEVFQEPGAGLSIKKRGQMEQDQSRDFLSRLKALMKNRGSNASLLILSYQFEPVYPKNLEGQAGAREIYAYFKERFQNAPGELEQDAIRQLTLDGQDYLVCLRRFESGARVRAKYLIAYNPVYNTDALLSGTARLVLLITASLAAVTLAAMWLVAGSISQPIRRLCGRARQIGQGDFSRVEEKASLRELEELNRAMDEMAEQLGRADAAQKAFFQNASHELRTPLMSISGYAQGIQCGVFEDNAEAAGTIVAESIRLTELVEGILTLSRLDNDQQDMEREAICLDAFLPECVRRLEGLALGRNVSLSLDTGGGLFVRADRRLLDRAVCNALSNCIRYARSEARVSARAQGEQAVITVSDDGPGFSGKDLAHLFERFYKGKGGNFGIGLALAKSSMEYMGGEIRAYNGEQGAVFELRLGLCEDKGQDGEPA